MPKTVSEVLEAALGYLKKRLYTQVQIVPFGAAQR